MQEKSPRLRRIQWIALTFLTLAGIVNYLDRSTLSIANHSVSGELGLSASQMGLLLSAFSFAYAFSQLPVGAMLDRFGARVMLGLGMFVWSCAQLCGGLVHTLPQFLAARIALGIGEAPQFPAGAKVVSEWYALRERGRPTGIFTTSSTIGPALAPPILTVLLLSFGWRWMFVVMGVLGIAVSIGWYMIYRNRADIALEPHEVKHLTEEEPLARAERKMTFAEWRGLFGNATTWGMIFGFMGVIYMVWLYLTWLPAYLEHERHLTIAKTGWVVSIPYIFGTLGMLSSGFVADGLMARGMAPIRSRKWPICCGLIGAAAFTVPAAFTPTLTLAIVYLSLAMYFVNLASGAAWALVSVAAPRHLVASLGSIQNFGGYFGGSFAPFITGVVVDKTHSFVNAFLISAGVAFAAALVYMFVVRVPIAEHADTGATPETRMTHP
ncbi:MULTISPECIES: MFS transporter [Paraburkholderia]|jgi:sugar phosphate permease|uniref:MFS transporter n=1 Tax=Paraburkholderia largidicola TaxID=3014751 RepID=A0A7I8BZY4_9BURK|nr:MULTISPECIES: MFS transporter [Paraburkholderia]BEU26697.1 MFS transporter [Paraburkholderia sp. 22B1P]GJH31826.1 MFS transporter [Paraburkholderia hospita]CAG9261403.1 putative L-galactonate transporter [Paraburkholderia caribensis]BCF93520.1 MFS transporter [Paraburkholderia sp. PGU16]GJH00659.1 MFS transporter [Paraburkholderia terrae]